MNDDTGDPRRGSANSVDEYGWTSASGPDSCNYITPKIVSLLKDLKVSRIADLGSGNGALCAALKGEGFDVVGIEYDKQGCGISRTRYPNIRFHNFGVQDDPRDLLKTEEKFDLVVSTEVVEHLYSPHLLPVFARAILKQNGILVLSTPYHGYLKNLALSMFDHWDAHHTPLWHGGHIKFWSEKTLRQLLTASGFKVTGFHGVGRLPLLWKSMILVARVI
jgi:2-polyprenyl-3-methyl-5-hydroxy-6-metoxy-1,4-benzoquinol methylase